MKLELKHLAYLPYEMKFISTMDDSDDIIRNNKIWTLDGVNKLFGSYCLLTKENSDAYDINTCKLILRPLSDLTKEIEYNGEKFVPSDWISKNYIGSKFDMDIKILYQFKTYEHLPYTVIENLLKWHFDVFGLIEQGLAININDLQHFQSC